MVMLIAGKASAQFSINAAYISQQHTFNYKNGSLSDFSQEDKWLKGGMLGVSLNAPLIGNIGIAPGAYLSYAQLKTTIEDSLQNITEPTTSSINLKIPFFLNYKIDIAVNSDIIIFGGPIFNVGLSTLANYKNVATQNDLHFDMGAAIGAGIQFYRFRVYVGYNVSLSNKDKKEFSLEDKESIQKAWEGSTLFAGLGVSLGSNDR